jgi:hypothetical protein
MALHKRIGSAVSGFWPWLAIFCLLTGSLRALSNDADTSAPVIKASTNATDELARISALQLQTLAELQAQQQATLKELEQARREIAASLAENSSNNAAQLLAITEMMMVQRKQDLKVVNTSYRIGLAIVVGMTGLLLLSILILNLTSIKAINRMTTMFSATSLMPGSEAQALADAREASKQLLLFPGEQGQRQLANALVQLQSRIQGLEHLAGKLRSEAHPTESGAASPPPGKLPETSVAG